MNGLTSYILSKKYVESTADSLGAVKGAPATIKSITEVDGGQKVTFEWTGTSGTKQTSDMTVKNGLSITNIEVNSDNTLTCTLSDGSTVTTANKIKTVKGSDGFSPSAKVEKVGDTATITITDKDGTTTATIKDGQGGSGGGTADVPIEKIKVNGELQTPVNKVVDITVPDAYDDTALVQRISDIESDYAKSSDIPSLSGYATETWVNEQGFLTQHQDISGKVDKVDGKSLIADTEIERLASVDNYDDTQVKTAIQTVANGLMDSVGYSADYKTIDIIAKNGVKKSVNVAPIISHASITELSDVDTTNKATGKALVYNATTNKHEYADVSGTDEKVKMDSSTDAKYLGELLDNVTIANENGKLKVKKLDGQEVTITEINYLKGLTMNVMDLVNMFSNGGVKIINTPVATYAELLTLDKSSFIEGISYLVYVLADENHDNAKTTYLVDKDSETPTYFGFADSQRDFTTNPIDLATEITGKLGIANMDSDAIKALFTVDDTYKTETATNNAFSTHGAKALYDELLLAIGGKANSSDLTAHKDDADIHVSTEDRTKWDSAKTHADSAHAPSDAQENIIESVKVNDQEITPDESKAVNIDLTGYAEHDEIIGENLIPFPYADGMSKTMNGIEYTVNPDGSVTAIGTAIETSAFVLAKSLSIDPNTTYILSGDLDDEITYKSSSILFNAETSSGASYWNYGKDKPAIFTGISVMANFRIRISKDETVNQTFYPMLEIGNIPHKYQQYKLSRNNLREDIDELKKLDDKLENQFNIASGDYITLTDSVDGNIVELGVKGNSYQKQLQGYNLIPFPYYSESGKSSSGLTFTYGDDFNITVNGTISSSYAGFAIARNIKVDAVNKKYMLIGLPTTGSGTTHKLRVRYVFPDGTMSDFTNCYNVNGDILDKKDSTYEGATMEIDLMCYDDKDNFQVRPMLVEVAEDGSYPTEYEAYCGGVPSPNPSYPQEINSVGDDGSLVVKSCGKNLIPYPYYRPSGFKYGGVTFDILNDSSIHYYGTATTRIWYMLGNASNIKLKAGHKYLFSIDKLVGDKTYVYFIDNSTGTDKWYILNYTRSKIVFTQNLDTIINIGIQVADGGTVDETVKIMLQECDENGEPIRGEEYELYKSSTTTIPLSEPLRAIGDVKDEITYQDGKWGVLRRTGSVILDGTEENCSASTVNDSEVSKCYRVEKELNKSDVGNYITSYFSSHFEVVNSPTLLKAQGKTLLNVSKTNSALYLSFGTDIATIDDFKNFLSTNKPEFVYKLGTPTFEPFADQTLPYLSTYDGVTNISNDDALSAEMTVKYPTTDASGVGSRNESRIAELAKDTDESLSSIGKCKNLLNPTLQTTTKNGITCTANGDGTYNIVGTNNTSSNAEFIFDAVINGTGQRKLLGVPKDSSGIILQTNYDGSWGQSLYWDTGNGAVLPNIEKLQGLAILVYAGATVNHTIKPMITTDLNATYDDFVPYTGDGETLTHDVAELKNDLSSSNAGAHNCVYRGKYLGNALTTEQKAQISAGTFNDLYIGDYWTIGGVNYRIAAFDYWLNSGDTQCTKHHVVIVPDSCLYSAKMNTTDVATGAYIGSEMYTTNLEQAKTIINDAFGSANILSHREYLPNATKATSDPTYESAGSWYDSTVELMNERMVYGADVFHNIEVNGAIPTNYTIDNSQLPLFALEHSRICNRAVWWLRDVVSAVSFARVDSFGNATTKSASNSFGVRPTFGITG